MMHNEKAAESLLRFLPFMHEKFLNPMERLAFHRMSKLQFFALMLLYRKGPQTMSQLSQAMQISKQQLTPLVDRLLEQKLGERQADSQDRRIILIEITQAGRDLMAEMMKQNLDALSQRLAVLPQEDLIELETMMLRVRELLEKAEGLAGNDGTQRGDCNG